ncbi:hypothetical protein BJ508DRAFT_321517 [Ascobolus immersus RN42]|uniref:Uncharacterized protein n=1 Tax=Ascobolus immersus RN42 TaxID=1160509 RepID=A0A3N4ILD8_ASCIM|nr:hypothetical protein BJ508DRAFT_321517 [Ascobolus immersus RN42]
MATTKEPVKFPWLRCLNCVQPTAHPLLVFNTISAWISHSLLCKKGKIDSDDFHRSLTIPPPKNGSYICPIEGCKEEQKELRLLVSHMWLSHQTLSEYLDSVPESLSSSMGYMGTESNLLSPSDQSSLPVQQASELQTPPSALAQHAPPLNSKVSTVPDSADKPTLQQPKDGVSSEEAKLPQNQQSSARVGVETLHDSQPRAKPKSALKPQPAQTPRPSKKVRFQEPPNPEPPQAREPQNTVLPPSSQDSSMLGPETDIQTGDQAQEGSLSLNATAAGKRPLEEDEEDITRLLKRATKKRMKERILSAYEEDGDFDEALKEVEKINRFHLSCLNMLSGLEDK